MHLVGSIIQIHWLKLEHYSSFNTSERDYYSHHHSAQSDTGVPQSVLAKQLPGHGLLLMSMQCQGQECECMTPTSLVLY